MHPPFIQADDVAALIGLPDGAAFLRRRDRLERDSAFPRPMPTSQRPLIWRRDNVQAWVQSQGRADSAPTLPMPQAQIAPHLRLIESAQTR